MEERTTTLTFVPSPEFRKILDELSVPKDEYVVEDPIIVEATTESGETMRYPTAVRERIVRCRDCKHGYPFCDSSSYAGMIDCLHFAQWDYYDDEPGVWPVKPDGFCAWGERRGE